MFGGTLWVLLANIFGFIILARAISRRKPALTSSAILVLVLTLPIIISKVKYAGYTESEDSVRVVIVQPNIDPYNEKFGSLTAEAQLERMLDLAEFKIEANTNYVVLPETALQESANVYLDQNKKLATVGLWENDLEASKSVLRLREFLDNHKQVKLISGMSSAYLFDENEELTPAARPLKPSGRHYESYNAALQVDVTDSVYVHHKSKLVVGVELMPFAGLLSELDALAMDLGGTTGSLGRQNSRGNFEATEWNHSITPAICYESIYGEYLGEYVMNGSDLIFVITNDGWWQDTPGYKQHLAYGRLRAIEHRRSIARCANTGISCFIDQRGDIHQATKWWVADSISGELNANDQITFYTRYGDQIARASMFFAVLLLLYTSVQALRKGTHQD